jgi:hypothetical protein
MEKIRFIITLALSLWLTGCQDYTQEIHTACISMTISNALPVQFWGPGEETFNEQEVYGVTKVCFNQPFQCDDPIGIQMFSYEEFDLSLRITDKNDNILSEVPFNRNESISEDYLDGVPITDWTNDIGSGPPWAPFGAYQFVTLIGIGSARALRIPVSGIPPGTLQVKYSNNFSGTGLGSTIQFRKGGVNVGTVSMSDADGGVNTTSVTLTDSPDEIRITAINVVQSSRTVTMYSLQIRSNEYLYDVNFTPDSVDVCDKIIRLQIIQEGSPDTIIASSDYISIQGNHPGTIAIDYSNHKDFNGINYSDMSPTPVFRLRIPAIFFEQDNPVEQEDHELSNGEIVRLYNKLEERRKLEIGFLPQYLHRKLQLVLMHDTVIIDGKEWIRREAYERAEGNKRYPLKRASVWLHDKNYIKENQL